MFLCLLLYLCISVCADSLCQWTAWMSSHQGGRWHSTEWSPRWKPNKAAIFKINHIVRPKKKKYLQFINSTKHATHAFFVTGYSCLMAIYKVCDCLAFALRYTWRVNNLLLKSVLYTGFQGFSLILHDCMIQQEAVIWLHYSLALSSTDTLSLYLFSAIGVLWLTCGILFKCFSQVLKHSPESSRWPQCFSLCWISWGSNSGCSCPGMFFNRRWGLW